MVTLESFGLSPGHMELAQRSALTFCKKNDYRGLKRYEAHAEALFVLTMIAVNHPEILDLEIKDNIKTLRMKMAYALKAYFSNFALSTVHYWLSKGKQIPKYEQAKDQYELGRSNVFLLLSDYLIDEIDWTIYFLLLEGNTPKTIGQRLKIDRNLIYRRMGAIESRISAKN